MVKFNMKNIRRNILIKDLLNKFNRLKNRFRTVALIFLHLLFLLQANQLLYPIGRYQSRYFSFQISVQAQNVILQLRQGTYSGKLYEAVFAVSEEAAPHKTDFLNLVEKIRINPKFKAVQKEEDRADIILQLLHEFVFRTYSGNDSRISEMFKNGLFNCVSSSLLYNMVLDYFNMKSKAAVVPEHVFSIFVASQRNIDAETTVKYGFNAGQERNITDELRRITGLVRVPASNPNRQVISNFQLVSYLFSQTGNFWGLSNRHETSLPLFVKSLLIYPQNQSGIEGLKLTYYKFAEQALNTGDYERSIGIMEELAQLLNSDATARYAAVAHFNNVFVRLMNEKKFEPAVSLIEKFRNHAMLGEHARKLSPNLYLQYADFLNKSGKFRSALKVIREKSEAFPELKEIIPILFHQRLSLLIQRKQYEKAIQIAIEGMQYDQKFINQLVNIYAVWVTALVQLNRQQDAYLVIKELAKSPYRNENANEIVSNYIQYYVSFLVHRGELQKAKEVMELETPGLPASIAANIREYYYVSGSAYLLKKGDLENSCQFFLHAAVHFNTGERFRAFQTNYPVRLVITAKETNQLQQADSLLEKIAQKLGAEYIKQAKSMLHYFYAVIDLNAGNYEAGIDNIRKGLSFFRSTHLMELLQNAAQHTVNNYFQNNNVDKALEIAEKAFLMAERTGGLLVLYKQTAIRAAQYYINQRKKDKAREILLRVKRLLPDDGDIERELNNLAGN